MKNFVTLICITMTLCVKLRDCDARDGNKWLRMTDGGGIQWSELYMYTCMCVCVCVYVCNQLSQYSFHFTVTLTPN